MATIRELFHNLGNDHNLLTIGAGVTKDLVEDCLKEEESEAIKNKLSAVLKNLEAIIHNAEEADKKTCEIHDRIYKLLDPDRENLR
jgi:hypothetical protein